MPEFVFGHRLLSTVKSTSTTQDIQKFAFVALGSNLGDSRATVLEALERLQALSDQPLLKSSLLQTLPVDCPPESPMFVNAVAGLLPRPDETAESLLGKLQAIEQEFGRSRSGVRNAARTLDLDLIAFGSETRAHEKLILPHPRAHLRRFVLEPLAEIAPDFVLPGQTKTARELLRQLAEAPTGEK